MPIDAPGLILRVNFKGLCFVRLTLFGAIWSGHFEGGSAWGWWWGEGGGEVPAAYNSKTISENEIKFVGVVENHRLINLVLFNWLMTSSLRHNDIINVQVFSFRKKFSNNSIF